MIRFVSSLVLLTLLGVLLMGVSGCATTDTQNASVRPWDAPQGWENGIPSGMYQNH